MSSQCQADHAHNPDGSCCASCLDDPPSSGKLPPVQAWPQRWADGYAPLMRLFLLGLSAGGVVIAFGLWGAGRGQLSARVLAGDVLLAVIVLVI